MLLNLVFILLIGCKSKPSFEKDGGTRFILSISYSDFFKSVAFNANEKQIKAVLTEMKDQPFKNFTEFIDAYQKTEAKLFPESKLALNFISFEWGNKINSNSTNEQITKELNLALNEAITSTIKIIQKRLDNLDFATAVIKTQNEQIIVDIPGNLNTKRIEGILTTTGNLGFWETYNNTEIFPYLNQINEYLAKSNYTPKANNKSKLGIQKPDSFELSYPLFSILKAATSPEGTVTPGSIIGFVSANDVEAVNQIFQKDSVLAFLPRNCKLLWSYPIKTENTTYYELIAVKGNRQNMPVLNGNAVANAKSKHSNNGNEILLQMNPEGAKLWKRITNDNVSLELAISVDDLVCVHPVVQNRIESGKSTITGRFTEEEAVDLASILNAGMYSLKLNFVKTEVIKASK